MTQLTGIDFSHGSKCLIDEDIDDGFIGFVSGHERAVERRAHHAGEGHTGGEVDRHRLEKSNRKYMMN